MLVGHQVDETLGFTSAWTGEQSYNPVCRLCLLEIELALCQSSLDRFHMPNFHTNLGIRATITLADSALAGWAIYPSIRRCVSSQYGIDLIKYLGAYKHESLT